MVHFVNPADPLPERQSIQPRPQSGVAIVNLGLLALIAAGSYAYWRASGTALYWPTAMFAAWCLAVQFALRRRLPASIRRQRRRRLENLAIGVLSGLALIGAIAIPLSKLIP